MEDEFFSAVKRFLEKEEEKNLWEEVYKAFLEGGEEGLRELINEKAQEIQRDFEKYIKEIGKKFEG